VSDCARPAPGPAASGEAATRFDLPVVSTTDPGWLLIEDGFNPAREREVESLFAVANGYVGTRGSLAEGSRYSSPATYLAGVFDVGAESGAVPELAIAPDWTHLRIIVAGNELGLEAGEALEHRRLLDLRQGILWRDWRHRDPAGRVTRLRFLRLASLADRHALLQSVTLTPENYSGHVHIEAAVEPVPERERLATLGPSGPPVVELRTATGVAVALSAWSRLATGARELVQPALERRAARVVESWDWEAEIGRTYRLDRLVSVHTSRDAERPSEAASRHLDGLVREGVDAVVEAHTRAWEARWQAADVHVDGDEQGRRALRFACYHLSSAANPADERASIGARALTGDAYKGHVFWDTEIYMLPFYTFTDPAAARSLLMYRCHTLPAARAKASRLGYRGALYAWESTDSGEETTPPVVLAPDGEVVRILTGEQEHHISADVAYAVWQNWQASGDDQFFVKAGAEIVLETARFWASRGRLEADGRYHIRGVIGPDEYHESVDDNAYTNGMARWNLERGAETVRILAERWPERWQELAGRLAVTPDEPAEWLRLAGAMATGFDPATGLFEQFQGYFDLEEIDLAAYEPRTVPMDVLLGRERTQRSKVLKQADVVLLLYLLWDRFPPEVRAANFRYYEPRTGHGSSLSPAIHALVAARLGDVALAERYLQQAARIDLANNMGNAAGGVHAAALGGLWQASVFGIGGTQSRADGLELNPHLLPQWRGLRFRIQWSGRRLEVRVNQQPAVVEVTLEGEEPVALALTGGEQAVIAPGRRYLASRADGRWGAWQEDPC
jgi:kojibiose phosphorylase